MQDLFPQNAVDVGYLAEGWLTSWLEQRNLRAHAWAHTVLVHAPSAATYLRSHGVVARHLPNWVDCDLFAQADPRACRRRWFPELTDKLLVLFAGVLGPAQDPARVVGLAAAARQDPRLHFVIAGDGVATGQLTREVKARRLTNVTLKPMMPPESYPELVACCDLFLVLLSHRIRYPVVPSKIGDGLAAGKPLLAALPEGDGAALIRRSQAGIVVPAQDAAGLYRALVHLADDEALRSRQAERGRDYARSQLHRPRVLTRIHELIRRLPAVTPS